MLGSEWHDGPGMKAVRWLGQGLLDSRAVLNAAGPGSELPWCLPPEIEPCLAGTGQN